MKPVSLLLRKLAWLLFALLALPVQACLELHGEPRQGALLWSRVKPGQQVFLEGEALKVSADGWVVLGFGRDETGTRELRVEGLNACTLTLTIQARDYRIQRIEGVPQRTVTPDPADLERIAREAALVRQAREHSGDQALFAQGFKWPVQGPISGVYGSQRIYNGDPGSPHYGVDVAVAKGTPVAAPAAGVVMLAEPDLFYSGGTIIIDHGSQVSSSFLHLSKVSVAVGERVESGDIVGEVGASGRATGPHLDWRMKWRQRWIDPQLLVPPMP